MRITCIGGGPAGLYLAVLMKKHDPSNEVMVLERNRVGDTFGWGVVFSDQTLSALQRSDPKTATQILDAFNHWDDIEVNFKGRHIRSSGHGFCGIGRRKLLNILQDRCTELGVNLRFETDVADDTQIDADLILAADGLNSRIRSKYASSFQPDTDLRQCRFVWLGTNKLFDAFTFAFEKTEWGWFQAHAYRFDENTSTFIDRRHVQGRGHRVLREALRQVPRRASAHVECCASARLGAVDSFSARRLQDVDRAEGRRQRQDAGGVDG